MDGRRDETLERQRKGACCSGMAQNIVFMHDLQLVLWPAPSVFASLELLLLV
jgi:hypothetical protein